MHRFQRSQASLRATDASRPAALSRRLAAPANPAVPCARCASAARYPCTRLTRPTACPCPSPAISVASCAASSQSTDVARPATSTWCVSAPVGPASLSRAPSARSPLATSHATPHPLDGVPLHHHRRSQLPPALRWLPPTPRYRARRRDAIAHRPCALFVSAVCNSRSQLSTA